MTVEELIEMLKEMPQDMEIHDRYKYCRYFLGKKSDCQMRKIEVIFFMDPEKDEED